MPVLGSVLNAESSFGRKRTGESVAKNKDGNRIRE